SVPTYLSRATRFSILSIIFTVVAAPTSERIRISSRSSSTSSSTLLFPTTALDTLSKNPWLDFSRPWFSVSFSCLLNIFLNQLIWGDIRFQTAKVRLYFKAHSSTILEEFKLCKLPIQR